MDLQGNPSSTHTGVSLCVGFLISQEQNCLWDGSENKSCRVPLKWNINSCSGITGRTIPRGLFFVLLHEPEKLPSEIRKRSHSLTKCW